MNSKLPFCMFQGKGGMASVMEKTHLCLRVVGVEKYFGYSCNDDMVNHGVELIKEGYEVHEKLHGSQPVRAFIDIDGDTGLTERDLNVIKCAFISSVGYEYKKYKKYGDIYTAGYKSETKHSYHIVFGDIVIKNKYAYNSLIKKTKELIAEAFELNEAKGKRINSYIDELKNNKTYSLRLPECAKSGDNTKCLICDKKTTLNDMFLNPIDGYEDQDEEGNKIITNVYHYNIHYSEGAEDMPEQKQHEKIEIDVKHENKFLKKIEKELPGVFSMVDYSKDKGIMCRMERNISHHCSSCGRVHDNDHAYIVRKQDELQMRCFKGDAPILTMKFEKSTVITPRELEDLPTPDENDQIALSTCEGAEHINCKYNTDGFTDDETKDIYLSAPCGSGKNFYLKQVREALPENATILAVSCRKSLSDQTTKDLELTNYQDIEGEINTHSAKCVMVQLESLKRVDISGYDIIILDELSAILSHMHKSQKNIQTGNKIMKLIASAKRILVCDADLKEEQINACKSVRPTHESRTIINNFQTWKGTNVNIHCGEGHETYNRQLMFSWLNTQHENKENNKPYNGCMVPCHSLKTARALHLEASKKYGADNVVLYCSDTCDVKKRADFSDTITAWSDKLAVFYTATITVGVDFNHAHMSNVFAFLNDNNSNSEEAVQMLYRGRKVKNMNISFKGSKSYLPTDRKTILNWMVKADQRKNIPVVFNSEYNPVIPHDKDTTRNANDLDEITNNWVGKMWISEVIKINRSKRYMLEQMVRTLELNGCTVDIPGRDNKEIDEDAHAEFKQQAQKEHCEFVAVQTLTAFNNASLTQDSLEDKKNNQTKTAEEKAELKGTFMIMDLLDITQADELKKLSMEDAADWVNYYEHVPDEYKQFKDFQEHDMAFTNHTSSLTLAHNREKYILLHKIYKVLEISPNDINIQIPISKFLSTEFKEMAELIEKNARRLFKDGHGARRNKIKNEANRIMSTFAIALKFIGASLTPVKVRKQKATNYALEYSWNGLDAIEPIPLHPKSKHYKDEYCDEEVNEEVNEEHDIFNTHDIVRITNNTVEFKRKEGQQYQQENESPKEHALRTHAEAIKCMKQLDMI